MSRPAVAVVPAADAGLAPVRVATYTRISTDEERQPNSLEAQTVRLAAFVDSQPGWRIERRYQDQFTGTVLARPALTRLLQDAKLGRFDLLLVYRVDRLARSIRGLAQIIDELAAADVVFRSATEPFDTGTPAGRMMMQMLGVFAEFERALIVERIVAGQERKAARGGWCGGRRPYGYDITPDREHLQPNPGEAPLVPVIFDLYANRRLGSAAVAAWLNERGYRTARGGPWSPAAVLRVIRNRSYLGQIYYRGHWYDAPHQPLIDTQLFAKAERLLTRRSEDVSTRRSNASDYLLSGRVRCGRCGQAYIGTAAHGRSQRYSYYTCLTRVRYGARQCANDRLPASKLEEAVIGRLRDILADRQLLERAVERAYKRLLTEQPRHQDELIALEAKLGETRAALERYFGAFERGSLPEDACAPRISELTEQARALERRRDEIAQTADDTEQPEKTRPDDLAALRAELEQALADGPLRQRKAILQLLIEEITVDSRAAIQPTFRVPAVRLLPQTMDLTGQLSNLSERLQTLLATVGAK